MNPRTKLLIILVLFSVPTLASFMTFFLWKNPGTTSNYGVLYSPAVPLPPMAARIADGGDLDKAAREQGLRGKWLIVTVARGGCDVACEKNLYAMRQARLILGREMDRVARVVILEGGAPAEAVLQSSQGAAWIADAPREWRAVAASEPGTALFLVDPLGNAFLHYGSDPDIKLLVKDLKQVLKASQIG